MKKILFLLFLFSCFSLFAENYRALKIFVPPVAGYAQSGDNAYFYKQLNFELALQNHSVVNGRRSSDYILNSTVMPLKDFRDAGIGENNTRIIEDDPERLFYYSATEDSIKQLPGQRVFLGLEQTGNTIQGRDSEFVLLLELVNTATKDVTARQYIVYEVTDYTVNHLIAVVIYNMLAGIPAVYKYDEWSDKYLFLNTSILWAPRFYRNEGVHGPVDYTINVGGKISLEYAFLNFLSVDAGIQIISDAYRAEKFDENEDENAIEKFGNSIVNVKTNRHSDVILEIPIAIKFILKPSDYMLIQPYAGTALNLSLMKDRSNPSLFSWFGGVQLGLKTGPGMIVFDPRFARDFVDTTIRDYPKRSNLVYRRNMVQIGLGYKIGFIPKTGNKKEF